MDWDAFIAEVVTDRPRLENAPLKAVLAQARIPEIMGLNDERMEGVQRALGDRYPMVDREVAEELKISAVPKPGGFMEPTGRQRVAYRFRDPEGAWAVAVDPESISLECVAYPGMVEFARRWVEVALAVGDLLDIKGQTRLGLRYINELDCPGDGQREDLQGWVREELLGIIGAHDPRTKTVLRSLTEARFEQPDDDICTIRYGIAPSEESPDLRIFLLDLDYFDPQERRFEVEDQVRALARFNDGNQEIFEWAFPEDTRAGFATTSEGGGKDD